MKLNKFLALTLFFICSAATAFAQQDTIPKGYYLFPIRPGEVNYLAGTMGELRPGHFHGGIDIKTGGVIGSPIHAAADGYISRIKVATSGYGNVLYMAHPNGTTTVYGHMESFSDDIAKWVREMQYQQKTFDIELFPEPGQFGFKRGEVIGLSGNSGSSGGPHLHFEVRDARQDVLNPLTYGFDEIKDDISPLVYGVALKPLTTGSRVNQQFKRIEFDPTLKGYDYVIPQPVEVWGKIGIELEAYDKLNGANNSNGFPCVEMTVNGEEVFSHNLDKFSFAETRHIEVHTDYATRKNTGDKFIRLYKADGNELSFYKLNEEKGAIMAREADSLYDVNIKLSDAYGNTRQLKLQLKATPPTEELSRNIIKEATEASVLENTFKFYAPIKENTSKIATLYANRMAYDLAPAYQEKDQAVYLWDLRAGLPDSVNACEETQHFNFSAIVPAEQEYNLYLSDMNLHFPGNSLFDTLYLQTNYRQTEGKEVFKIGEDVQPLKNSIYLKLKPQQEYSDKARTHVYSYNGNGYYGWEGGDWEGNELNFRTRSLGEYTLLTDSVAPEIRPVRVNKNSISLKIWDDLSGIRSFETYVDGEWVLMNYDHKRQVIWSEKLNQDLPFSGPVEVKVTDLAGNEQVFTSKI